ncbi:uncharacterized protein Dwil_GK24715 [Drosophila willistoni]|uniref:CHK kinase-like domain-containing protein n=1 Tax=Drosophila willistoni TaxID=7260 RepID=B4MZT6_DROWI|nr:uncharacterized protein LOC6643759 [Drosophila willistoni]EDW77871.1 uncharacterized protein Dwil_GK24715 [Drosophila willistoni]
MLLSRSECVEILKNVLKQKSTTNDHKEEDVKLLDYNFVRDHTPMGYLGDYYELTLTYSNAADGNAKQEKLFIKSLPELSAEAQKEAIFKKEAWLYETLLADMQQYSKLKWRANCYFTRSDLLVLENVTLAGYHLSATTELCETSLFQLMHSLAAFHSASLIYEQQTEQNIGQEFGHYLQEITVASEIAWFTTGLSAVLAIIRSLPEFAANRDFIDSELLGIMEGIYVQAKPSDRYRNVLCHRDPWAGNIFFPSQPEQVALLVDFQTCRYTPPATDLAFSLYMNLSSAERERLASISLEIYYNALDANLQEFGLQAEQFLTKSELLKSFEEFRLFGVVYRAVAATIVKVPVEFVTNDFKYVDRSECLLRYMQENDAFNSYMLECCSEVMEVALKS